MPSSYTTNTGLEKPGDGEQAGSWGGTVNDNMDILDRALNGVGSIALSGTTHTLTTSDGVLSDGQYRVLVLGGTPSGTNTITLSPNDAQHVYFVRNNSGQSAVFTQGSGGDVTIANGKSAIIYADGGGAGAAVVDITSTFNFQTSSAALTAIAALATTDNNFIVGNGSTWVAESGATARTSLGLGSIATQAANNVSISGGSITGITDLAVADGGTGASDAATARTNLGLAIGTNVQAYDPALQSISGLTTSADQMIYTTGSDTYATTGITSAGRALLDDADASAQRTTLGLGTMAVVNSPVPVANGGTGQSTQPTNGQLLIGTNSGTFNLSGLSAGSGISITNGTGSITIASTAAGSVTSVSGTGTVNGLTLTGTVTSSGSLTLGGTLAINNADWSGTDLSVANGGTGASSFTANNVLLGNGTSAFQVVAPGSSGNVLTSNGTTWVSQANPASLTGITEGSSPFETSLGSGAGAVNTGTGNTFIGYDAGNDNTSGVRNTAIGYQALDANVTNNDNTAVGNGALGSSTANANVAVGSGSLATCTTGADNCGVGYQSLYSVLTGYSNTAIGSTSGYNITDGYQNSIVGRTAGYNLTTGNNNSAVGFRALYSAQSTSGSVAIGYDALFSATGSSNTSVGYQAGNSITSGTGNTLLGYDVDTGSATAQDRIVIGREVSGSADDRITIGITTNKAELDLDGSDTSWAASSDSRLKTNVAPYSAGLSFINDLSVVSFNWKKKRDVPEDLVGYHADSDDPVHGKPGKTYHGFIAQDVKKALDDHPEVADGQHFWKLREDGVQTTAPSDLVPILVRAIQELSSQVALLRSELDAIKSA